MTALALVRNDPLPDPDVDPAAPVVVLKFGSSVLRTLADAPRVASEAYAHVRAGRKVVAVVSAFGGHTDRLLADARSLGLAHDNDLLPGYVALGEEKAAALCAVACDRVGLDAVALSVRELGLVAEGPSEHARPVGLEGEALGRALQGHDVVIVPGFGAVRPNGRVALLGRGGSDLTAVVLAAELGLDRVRLVKDVDGLYDRDPNCAEGSARRYDRASWETARRLGGALVQHDAIDLAEARGVEIEVAALGRPDATVIGHDDAEPRPAAPFAPLRVAIAGCGVVGGGLLQRLLADPEVEVVGVLVRDPSKARDVDCPPGLLTADADELLSRRPEVLLEALSEGRAGHELIRRALAAGVDVASANKQAISLDPQGLADLAAASNARLSYSAAVGGGAPMIETVRAARAAGPVASFEAVLNGTVNFMLDRLNEGSGFDAALSAARDAGFAEEDPSSDLEGHDSAAKVRLLAWEAFGQAPPAVALQALDADRLPGAGAKQLGRCRPGEHGLDASVSLDEGVAEPLFAGLRGERNALKVVGEDGRVWTCKGRGAGRWATCESVLADLGDLMRIRRA